MRLNDIAVWIKIRHPDIEPSVLSEAFGIVPEFSWRAGEPRIESEAAHAARRESYWVAELPMPRIPSEFISLESALMWAALMFERRKDFWAELQAEGATAQVTVTLGNSASSDFNLSHNVLTMLSKYGLSVSVQSCTVAEAAA